MLPTELWYWDPKRAESLTNHEVFTKTTEDNMGWEKVIATIIVVVAEQAVKELISNIED